MARAPPEPIPLQRAAAQVALPRVTVLSAGLETTAGAALIAVAAAPTVVVARTWAEPPAASAAPAQPGTAARTPAVS